MTTLVKREHNVSPVAKVFVRLFPCGAFWAHGVPLDALKSPTSVGTHIFHLLPVIPRRSSAVPRYDNTILRIEFPCLIDLKTRLKCVAHNMPHEIKKDNKTSWRNTNIVFFFVVSRSFDITIQYNTIHYNTIQYNTTQYNTIQYNIFSFSSFWLCCGPHILSWLKCGGGCTPFIF